jgi:quercetin dioxygenase-like cupin family protein
MESQLEKLRELTMALPDLRELTKFNTDGTVNYDVTEGTGMGVCLFNTPDIAVQRVSYSKGMTFPGHNHNEIEIAIVYVGLFRSFTAKHGVIDQKPGDIVRFEPGENHSHEALEDVELIAITIPASKDYPHAG